MNRTIPLFFVLFSLLVPVASAQDRSTTSDEATESSESPRVLHKLKTELDMDTVDIHGATVGPVGARVDGRTLATFKALMRLRANFTPELIDSVNQIR